MSIKFGWIIVLANMIGMLVFGANYFKFLSKYITIALTFLFDFSMKFATYISELLMNGFS